MTPPPPPARAPAGGVQVYREISRLRALPQRSQEQEHRLASMVEGYAYQGDATCAADGMCQVRDCSLLDMWAACVAGDRPRTRGGVTRACS